MEASPPPAVLTITDLNHLGAGQHRITSGLKSGSLVRLTRGACVDASALEGNARTEAERRHLLTARARLRQFDGRAAASHHTGALLHGLPRWGVDLRRIHLTRTTDATARATSDLVLHQPCRGQTTLITEDGLSVLSPADCIVGVGLGSAPRRALASSALIAADAALHVGLVTHADLDAALERFKGYRAIAPIREELAHADGRHESPAETRTAQVLRELGVAFTPQVRLDIDGVRYRCDFRLDEHRVIVEVDGFGKYGQTPEEISKALLDEKRREDAIRRQGYVVVRITWDDLRNPGRVKQRIRQAIADAGRLPRL